MIGLIAVLVLLPGCGDGRPKRVPVSGTVLIDGKPLTSGFITFHTGGGRPASGHIDKQGRFTLTCFDKDDGVMLGTHPISVEATETLDANHMRWLIPQKYNSPKTSGLEVEIKGPTNSLTIKLTWGNDKPFVQTLKSGS